MEQPGGGRASWPAAFRRRQQAGRRCQPAQALVEFALTGSFMALLLVGVVDFARVFYFDVVTSGAAMEAARAAASGLPDNDVYAVARTSAPSWMSSDLALAITPSSSTRAALGTTPVWTTGTASYMFTPLTPLTSTFMGSSITFTRKVSQRMRTPCVNSATATC